VRLSMIWLVRILWFMLIGGWGRRRIQARLEAGPWPWKQKPKGAVRTHYCQQNPHAQWLKGVYGMRHAPKFSDHEIPLSEIFMEILSTKTPIHKSYSSKTHNLSFFAWLEAIWSSEYPLHFWHYFSSTPNHARAFAAEFIMATS
jgi:hypothetical protein